MVFIDSVIASPKVFFELLHDKSLERFVKWPLHADHLNFEIINTYPHDGLSRNNLTSQLVWNPTSSKHVPQGLSFFDRLVLTTSSSDNTIVKWML